MGENVKILDSIHEPDQYDIDDSMILPPLSPEEAAKGDCPRTERQVSSGSGAAAGDTGCSYQLKSL